MGIREWLFGRKPLKDSTQKVPAIPPHDAGADRREGMKKALLVEAEQYANALNEVFDSFRAHTGRQVGKSQADKFIFQLSSPEHMAASSVTLREPDTALLYYVLHYLQDSHPVHERLRDCLSGDEFTYDYIKGLFVAFRATLQTDYRLTSGW